MVIRKRELVFWDIDTQNDFMNKDGKLYVTDAESIKPNLRKLTNYAKQKGLMIIATKDMHEKTDPEFIENGGPFPFHCMADEKGSDKIDETKLDDPVIIKNTPYRQEKLLELLEKDGEIIIEKQTYNVFDNPNTKNIIRLLGIDNVVVYGLASDYCLKWAVDGLASLGLDVIVISDAIKAVKEEDGVKSVENMRSRGVLLMTTDEVMETY